jgi:hypothetical protein
MEAAVDQVKQRLLRATRTLDAADVPYAVVGGNAVAAWVAQIDPDAVRTTRDVDLLVNRDDLDRIIRGMESDGWQYHVVNHVPLFIDGPNGRPSAGVHLVFANERVYPNDPVATPNVAESFRGDDYQIVELDALVRMKLVANRRKDQVHLLDMIRLGLVDATWPARFPPPLDARLQELIDDPDG